MATHVASKMLRAAGLLKTYRVSGLVWVGACGRTLSDSVSSEGDGEKTNIAK